MTIGALIDRCYREWLTPPSEAPARFVMNNAGDMTATDTSLITETSMLSPEQEDAIGPGTVIEIESELMTVTAVTGTSPDLTLTLDADGSGNRRPALGTTAAAHVDGLPILISPDFGRQIVFDALGDAIDDLWPRLWKIKTDIISTNTSWVDVDATVEEILETKIQSGSQWATVDPGQIELLVDFPLASSERAVQYGPVVPSGKAAIIKYKAKASRPTTEADTLASLNIESSWEKAITVGVAASFLRRVDIDSATVDYITEALEHEGFPPGSGESVSNALLRYQDFLIGRRAQAQNIRTLPTQVIERSL